MARTKRRRFACDYCTAERHYGGMVLAYPDAGGYLHCLCDVHAVSVTLWLRGFDDEEEMAEQIVAAGLRSDE